MNKILIPFLLLSTSVFANDTYSEYPIFGSSKAPATTTSVKIDGKNIVEINVNQDDMMAGAKFDMGQYLSNTFKPNMAYLGFNYYRFGTETTQEMFQVTALAKDFLNATQGVKVGFGVKPTFLSVSVPLANDKTFLAFPIGVEGEVFLPTKNLFPISMSASAYYAPTPLSLSDAESYFEGEARINAQVLSHIKAYAGYRYIQTNFKNAWTDSQLNSSIFGGLSVSF